VTKRRVLGATAFAAPKERHNLLSPGCATVLHTSHFNVAEIGLLPAYQSRVYPQQPGPSAAIPPLRSRVSKTACAARYGDYFTAPLLPYDHPNGFVVSHLSNSRDGRLGVPSAS
jgi:hypothetical protein